MTKLDLIEIIFITIVLILGFGLMIKVILSENKDE
ncbi:hypothetical protein O6B97_06665 [Campylobacter ureolyticus]|uniref:Small hydrophobic protein n=1 Tax=Campylobacter ureolyticus TaxID=827 RepID=A0A381EE05_9BACT|nr:hypothetical protein [Campylobacter ureolyticus]MCR8684688.1 hypothetical protein [Campylobacter ureolyticus]MCR8699780.1 hypothetical protein [Campylobacter ureolyticus]MCZ6104185.1 hypothetical protein [Campylobacter ureolyticus]MCZ6104460.1 hypothetical protein [Campylobacter ureolyticus]MCZ6111254.1 hypothetical protein [Campylobacter ureolyticus]